MVRVVSTDNCFPEALLVGTLKPLTLVLSPSAKGRGDKDFRSASFTKRGQSTNTTMAKLWKLNILD
jgi:hypothetical protein